MPPRPARAARGDRDTLLESLQRGIGAHQGGNLAEAARLYKVVLRRQPDNFAALHLLGMLEGQRGRWDKAERLIGDALKRDESIAEVWSNLGNVQHQRGRLDEALASFDRALALKPDHATALNNRGSVLLALKRPEQALAAFDAAFAADTGFAEVLHSRGIALRALNRPEEALASFERALAINPGIAQAHADRGAILADSGRSVEAVAAFDQALALEPQLPEAHYNRGVTLVQLGRLDEALASFDAAIAAAPALAAAHSNRGSVLVQLGRPDEALASFDRALAADPGFLAALSEKGHAAQALGRHALAAESFERLVGRDGDYPYALGNLLHARALCCDWQAFGVLRSLVLQGVEGGRRTAFPGHLLALAPTPAEQRRAAEVWVEDHYGTAAPRRAPRAPGGAKIRLAYVSGNFNEHPACALLAGLFERHDRTRFETTAISFGPDDGSVMRRRMTRAFDRFIDVRGRPDEEIAGLMATRGIDIAVDLMGFSEGARPGILLRRPAEIQVSYLGHCGTTALPSLDYIVADACVIPEAERRFYSERVVTLPHTFFVSDDTRAIAARGPARADEGLPETGFVFCCFNDNDRIAPEVFAIWMRLLAAVEGSVLWLMKPNDTAMRNLRQAASEHAVAPERIVFAARVPPEDHLARHRLADLSLDTLPCNAHAAACDSLWAGTPLVTRIGTTFPGRVAASILGAAGLPELITETEEGYETLALRLAREPAMLAAVKEKLARNRTTHPLFDTDRFRRHIEAAYLAMVERHRRGEAPAAFTVDPID